MVSLFVELFFCTDNQYTAGTIHWTKRRRSFSYICFRCIQRFFYRSTKSSMNVQGPTFSVLCFASTIGIPLSYTEKQFMLDCDEIHGKCGCSLRSEMFFQLQTLKGDDFSCTCSLQGLVQFICASKKFKW